MVSAVFRKKNESGFTLIELLVVILIIGILAAIAVPIFLNQRKSAAEASVKSDLKSAATAMETEIIKNKSYPLTLPNTIKTSAGVTLSNAVKPWTTVAATLPDGTTADVRWRVKANTLQFSRYSSVAAPITLSASAWACSSGTNGSLGASADLVYSADPESIDSWIPLNVCPVGDTLANVTVRFKVSSGAYTPVFNVLAADPNPVYNTFCIEGFHSGDPTNIWRYSSIGGGLAKGKC